MNTTVWLTGIPILVVLVALIGLVTYLLDDPHLGWMIAICSSALYLALGAVVWVLS